MAKIIVTGVRHLDFTTPKGDQIQGSKLFFLSKNPDVNGYITAEKFLSASVMQNLGLTPATFDNLVMCECDVDFDLNGHLVGIKKNAGLKLEPIKI